uniref:Transposase n=1 Tax=Erysipelothrix tonsillarum TaxID=38402 RepID=A0A6S6I2P7_9FIRM|nr:transposase [Erysipelothrix tonsillarum]
MITGILKRDGYSIGKNTVQRIMHRFNLQCRVKQKRQNLYRGKEALVANNVLDRNFKATRPLEKLSTDITYLPLGETNLYLSSIMDLYDGQIIAYTIGTIQDIEFVSNTANQLPEIMSEFIIQMDQGSVYTSRAYQTLIQNKGITIRMSSKGTPADNAPIESFHASLKSETSTDLQN